MTHIKLLAATFGAAMLLALASDPAAAQARGRAVPRPGPPVASGPARPVYRPPVYRAPYYRGGYPYRYGYPYPYYYGYPHGSVGFYFGFPYGYVGFGWGVPYAGYAYAGYPYAYPYGYPYPFAGYPYPYRPYGGVRLNIAQRDAQVYIDGYYGGIVDQYDGTFQQVNLEPGAHHIEVRAPGFETSSFDVNVAPGQTVTWRTNLKPAP